MNVGLLKKLVIDHGRCRKRKYIMPHLLLVFSIEWLEKKQREANPPGTFKLFNMPDDIIMDILMRLPLRSLCCLRCVSKACLDMVDSPSFTTLHRERLLKMSSNDYVAAASSEVPQLIQLQYNYPSITWQPLEIDDECRLTQTKYPLHVSKMFNALDFVFCNLFFFQRNVREYMESINPNSYYLIDPLRREGLRIPHCPTNHKDLVHQFGMGFDNTTNTYKIVCVSGSLENHHATTHIYVLGTESSSWREIWSVAPRPLSRKNVCAYGDMHWLVEEAGSHVNVAGGSHIISFDFKKEEFCWTPHPTLKRLRPGFGNSRLLEDLHLLNMKGSMAMVDTNSSKEYIDIWVVKSYLKKEWTLDYRINTQALAGYSKGGLRSHSCYEWEHGIAFHNGRMCYFLDLRNNSIKYMSGRFRSIYSFIGGLLISLKKL